MTQKLLFGVLFGPYFFEDEDRQAITVISQHYTEMINEFLSLKLTLKHNLWFQQNGAVTHMAVIGVAVLRHLFLQWVISHFGDVPRPPRSPDLTAPDFFLWGYLKSKVYSRCPVDLNALKHTIWDKIVNISEETLPEVMRSFSTHVHLCIQDGGGHLKTSYTKSETM